MFYAGFCVQQDHEVAVSLPSASHPKLQAKPACQHAKKPQTIQLRFFCEFLQEGAVLEIRE
ncbi:hypothetical protein C3766_08135 [Heyndrickxia coagulans]|nr:hypothetical protein C3766_08135 [Heyndrickxia coagulans]